MQNRNETVAEHVYNIKVVMLLISFDHNRMLICSYGTYIDTCSSVTLLHDITTDSNSTAALMILILKTWIQYTPVGCCMSNQLVHVVLLADGKSIYCSISQRLCFIRCSEKFYESHDITYQMSRTGRRIGIWLGRWNWHTTKRTSR